MVRIGGSITINSSSPFSSPIIDPNVLGSPIDTEILTEGVLSAQRLFSLSSFSKNIFGLTAPAPLSGRVPTKGDITQFIESGAANFGHGVGSCSMAPHGAKWGVVDPEFRVRGAKGLRIVDASVIVRFLHLKRTNLILQLTAICHKWAHPGTCLRHCGMGFCRYQTSMGIKPGGERSEQKYETKKIEARPFFLGLLAWYHLSPICSFSLHKFSVRGDRKSV